MGTHHQHRVTVQAAERLSTSERYPCCGLLSVAYLLASGLRLKIVCSDACRGSTLHACGLPGGVSTFDILHAELAVADRPTPKGPDFLFPTSPLVTLSFASRAGQTQRLRDATRPAARHGQRQLCLWLRYVQPSSHQWSFSWAGAPSPGTRHYRLVTLLLSLAGKCCAQST